MIGLHEIVYILNLSVDHRIKVKSCNIDIAEGSKLPVPNFNSWKIPLHYVGERKTLIHCIIEQYLNKTFTGAMDTCALAF